MSSAQACKHPDAGAVFLGMEEDVIPEADYRARELSHIRHELESEVMETHAKLQSKLSQLDQISSGLAPRPRRQPVSCF